MNQRLQNILSVATLAASLFVGSCESLRLGATVNTPRVETTASAPQHPVRS